MSIINIITEKIVLPLSDMALGKPVIASDSGGTSEIIQNNKTGFIIHNKSDVELEKKIMSLLKDKNMRETMGKLGKERIIESFSITKMIEKFVRLYNKFNILR